MIRKLLGWIPQSTSHMVPEHMSVSVNLVGFRPADKKWAQMKAVWDACEAAGIEAPSEVDEFFNYDPPNDAGVEVELEEHECCSQYRESGIDGFDIDVSKLPDDVTLVRFFISW